MRAIYLSLALSVLSVGVLVVSPELRGHFIGASIHATAAGYRLYHGIDSNVRPSIESKITVALTQGLKLGVADRTGAINDLATYRTRTSLEQKALKPFPKLFSGCTMEEVDGGINGLKAAWVQCGKSVPDDSTKPQKVALYCHGGGYVIGSVDSYAGGVANVAKVWQELLEADSSVKDTRLRFLIFDYGLVPEHTLENILDQGIGVYSWLLDNAGYAPEDVIFVGDSAGGNMVHMLQKVLLDRGSPSLPAGAIAFSPWIDMTASTGSYEANNGKDPCLSADVALALRDLVAPTEAMQQAYSPALFPLSTLRQFKPTLNIIGELDVLVDENIIFQGKVHEIDHLAVAYYPGLFHDFIFATGNFPEAKESLVDCWEFLRKHRSI